MTNAAIQLNNLTTTNLTIDAEFGKNTGKILRALLAPAGQPGDSIDVGDIASLSDLNINPQIQQLLNAPAKISVTIARGTTDLDGSDASAVIDASGMSGASPRLVVAIAAGGAGARDVSVYTTAFPFAALLTDIQVMVSTAVAGTIIARDATGGLGNALSAANSTAALGRVRDPGTGQTAGDGVVPALARNSSLVLRMTAGDAACRVIMEFARVS
jgi:hypothetical protein